jgi:hypothetical protein
MSKGTAHEILADLARVRQELGRLPSRVEYGVHGKFPGAAVTDTFGSFHLMLKCSGLLYSAKGKRNKQDLRKQHFEAVTKASDQRRVSVPPEISKHILVIPDLHAPFQHEDAIDFLAHLASKYKFDRVICLGDEIDGHAWSFHDADPDSLSPGHELEAAIGVLQPLYKLFPRVDLCDSNHGSLIFRRAKHFGLPQHVIKPYGEVLGAPVGWKWHFEIKAQMTNGESVLFHHSYGANVLRVSQQRGMSMVQGHHHSQQSIQWWRNYDRQYFAAFAGCLVDETSLAMAYGKNSQNRPVLGALRIDDGKPHLEPMLLDARGRWVGK